MSQSQRTAYFDNAKFFTDDLGRLQSLTAAFYRRSEVLS